jgi:hypothetical protein
MILRDVGVGSARKHMARNGLFHAIRNPFFIDLHAAKLFRSYPRATQGV